MSSCGGFPGRFGPPFVNTTDTGLVVWRASFSNALSTSHHSQGCCLPQALRITRFSIFSYQSLA